MKSSENEKENEMQRTAATGLKCAVKDMPHVAECPVCHRPIHAVLDDFETAVARFVHKFGADCTISAGTFGGLQTR